MARDKVKSEKIEQGAEEKSPKAKRGRLAMTKSPKAKVDSVKTTPMKAKADGAKAPKKKPTHPPTPKMVAEAFSTLKNRKGHTLAAIRNFITKNYDCDVNKVIQSNIKKYIRAEFEAGRIKMVGVGEDDDDEVDLNFSKRFALKK